MAGIASCSGTRVTRTSEKAVVDLSGKWNETDAMLVSDHMVKTLLQDSWLSVFAHWNDRKPVIRLGKIVNKTTEHIATKTFGRDIELALLSSNKGELVASGIAKKEIRKEREDYHEHNKDPAGTRVHKEKEIDFILRGSIHSIEDQIAGTKVVYYQVDLELVTVSDNENKWIGQKRIKKIIEKPLAKW